MNNAPGAPAAEQLDRPALDESTRAQIARPNEVATSPTPPAASLDPGKYKGRNGLGKALHARQVPPMALRRNRSAPVPRFVPPVPPPAESERPHSAISAAG